MLGIDDMREYMKSYTEVDRNAHAIRSNSCNRLAGIIEGIVMCHPLCDCISIDAVISRACTKAPKDSEDMYEIDGDFIRELFDNIRMEF